jgi:transcriptional regulator with XRE-family HTH domain
MNAKKLPDVGARVRVLRERYGLSLRSLAEMCDVSPNTISLIERGLSSPSVNTLQCLATGLGVPITAFFETEEPPARLVLTRSHERIRTKIPGMTMEHLGSGLSNQALASFLVTLEPGAGAGAKPVVHLGEEWVYCLEGAIVYEVEEEQFRLEPGDSLLFEASLPHRWRNPGPLPASIILVLQTEGTSDVAVEEHLRP